MPEVSIHSNRFGDLSLSEETILDFPEGLIGLHGFHRFGTIEPNVPDSPFKCLVSLEDVEIGFAIADPADLFSDYEVDLTTETEVLDIKGDEDLALYVILTVPPDPIRTTANLLAPLLVNVKTRIARQLVLSDSRYSTRHPIIAPRPAT